MTDFVGAIMSGLILIALLSLIVYVIVSEGPFLLTVSSFAIAGGFLGWLYGRSVTKR